MPESAKHISTSWKKHLAQQSVVCACISAPTENTEDNPKICWHSVIINVLQDVPNKGNFRTHSPKGSNKSVNF